MRVAFIISSLQNSGPIVFTKNLIDGLVALGVEIDVFYFNDVRQINIDVRCKELSFFQKINFDGYDIIHTTGALPDLYATFHSFFKNFVWIISAHNLYKVDLIMLYGSLRGGLKALLWSFAMRRVSNIIVSSVQMMDYYKRVVGNKKYSIIPYGVPSCDEFNNKFPIEAEFLEALRSKYDVIGCVGVLVARKGFDLIITAASKIPNIAVVIIGDGPERQKLANLIDDLFLNDRVFLLGYRSSSFDYYKYFDVFALTSYSEGFGLAMLEAFSIGKPVVCSALDIYTDYFTNNDVCFFEVGNSDALILAVNRILINKAYFEYASKKIYCKHFTLRSMAQRHLDLYVSCVI